MLNPREKFSNKGAGTKHSNSPQVKAASSKRKLSTEFAASFTQRQSSLLLGLHKNEIMQIKACLLLLSPAPAFPLFCCKLNGFTNLSHRAWIFGKISPPSWDEAVIGCDLLLPKIAFSLGGRGIKLLWRTQTSIQLQNREEQRRQDVLSRRNLAFEEKF